MKLKFPVFNDHKAEGFYGLRILPEHHACIPHLVLGALSIVYPLLVQFFVMYQLSQIAYKGEIWDDTVDIMEFYIGRLFGHYLLSSPTCT